MATNTFYSESLDDCEMDNTNFNNIKLKKGVNISDLKSQTGAIFEIDGEDNSNNKSQCNNVKQDFNQDLLYVCSGINDKYEENSCSDAEDDMDPFEKLAVKMEDISGDEGVLKMEVEPGVGNDIPDGSRVIFHYSAFLEYADEPFDSTLLRNRPQKACLSEEDTLVGLKIGLKSMRKKEKSLFLVRPKYAFGEMGCPPRIPLNASILYEVRLINFIDRSGADKFESLNYEQQSSATFDQKIKAARDYHRQGNEDYKGQHLQKAKSSYRRATWLLENTSAKDEEDQKRQADMLFRIHSNLAQVNLDLKEPKRACTECRLAFEIPVEVNEDVKAKLYFRYAKAKMMLNDYNISRKYLLKAQHIRPNNPEISALLEELVKRKYKYAQREKVICRKMMGMYVKDDDSESVNGVSRKLKNNDAKLLDPEWEKAFKFQLEKFYSNSHRKELPLPPTLTFEEVKYASTSAEKLDMQIEKRQIGNSVLWKVVKF